MIESDVFRASWLGNSDRGCYFDVWENEGQWYWAVWVDLELQLEDYRSSADIRLGYCGPRS